MDRKLLVFVTVFAACFGLVYGEECCKAYTDLSGNHHASQFCADYCCVEFSLSTFTEGSLESCCSDILRQVPASLRDEECIDWIKDNMWVPIVGGILGLMLLISLVTCCCCCGCCACFRSSGARGVVVTGGPAHTVIMHSQQQQMQTANPVHTGYNQ